MGYCGAQPHKLSAEQQEDWQFLKQPLRIGHYLPSRTILFAHQTPPPNSLSVRHRDNAMPTAFPDHGNLQLGIAAGKRMNPKLGAREKYKNGWCGRTVPSQSEVRLFAGVLSSLDSIAQASFSLHRRNQAE